MRHGLGIAAAFAALVAIGGDAAAAPPPPSGAAGASTKAPGAVVAGASTRVPGAVGASTKAPAGASSSLIHGLRSSDPSQIQTALDEAHAAGRAGPAVVTEIAALLDRGVPVPLAVAALDVLGDAEIEGATASVVPYLAHRDARVRQAAARALGKTRGPSAIPPLRRALGDRDGVVRTLSAASLGAMKARDAVPDLFLALEHGVDGSATTLGRICAGGECDRLIGMVGRQPLSMLAAGIDVVLFRTDAAVSDDTKVKAVQRMRDLATPEANRFLRDAQQRWPKEGPVRVKHAIDQAVLATGGAGASP